MMSNDSGNGLDDILDLSAPAEDTESVLEETERTIQEMDRRIQRQLNAIIHHAKFWALEKAWRELAYLVDQIPDEADVEVRVLSAGMPETRDDFLNASGLSATALARNLSAAVNAPDESPYSALVMLYETDRSAEYLTFLSRAAMLGSTFHTPLITAAASKFLGATSFAAVDRIKDLPSRLSGPEYVKWNNFCSEDEARYLVHCVVGFALRFPHSIAGATEGLENFREDTWRGGTPAVMWGNPAVGMAAALVRAHHERGDIVKVNGISEGRLDALPPIPDPDSKTKKLSPIEAVLPNEKCVALAMHGIAALSLPDPDGPPAFLSAQTAIRRRSFDSSELTVQIMAYSRLMWVFFACRVSQSLRLLFDTAGLQGVAHADVQSRLDDWLSSQTAAEGESGKPFLKAAAEVSQPEDSEGWLLAHLEVCPAYDWEGIESDLHIDVWLPR